jgi:hypothetical protein
LFFRTGANANITHVALYLGNRRFIHSASAGANTGVIYSSLDEEYWARTFAGAGRVFPETAPFAFKTTKGEFAPYLELAWQSYSSNSNDFNLAADLSASFRFSTGIRWLLNLHQSFQ